MTQPDEAMPDNLPRDPIELFDRWYGEAEECDAIKYSHAMCLSTVDPEGLPEARIVLLKMRDGAEFVFFTDARSPTGRSLDHLPEAALTFYWGPLDRQVRIRGAVEKADDEISDRCFRFRPRPSQITAWASQQSRPLDARADLDRRYERYADEFAGEETVPRPPYWQAYRLRPRSIEFWRAKAKRLHDRRLYTRADDGAWEVCRLEP